jgi:hypothetical protein
MKRWPGRYWDTLWGTLKKVVPRVRSMVSHLVKVKQRTVSGQVGIGLLGLTQTGISITFGQFRGW